MGHIMKRTISKDLGSGENQEFQTGINRDLTSGKMYEISKLKIIILITLFANLTIRTFLIVP